MKKLALNVSLILCLVVCVFVISCKGGTSGHKADEEAAQKSLDAWVQMLDAADYGATWEAASSYFKNAITKDDWMKMMNDVRQPMGKKVSRTQKAREYTKQLPGAPDGEYVVFEFETTFENKKNAVETITAMKDTDGSWKVGGYYIK